MPQVPIVVEFLAFTLLLICGLLSGVTRLAEPEYQQVEAPAWTHWTWRLFTFGSLL